MPVNHGSLILFAQAQKFDANRPPANLDEAFALLAAYIGVVIGVSVCSLVIWLVVNGLFCMSMAKALNACSESNRQMSPGLVWLVLIPCFHVVWYFFIVLWIPDTLKKEFESRDEDDGSNYGKTMGLTSAILLAVNWGLCAVPYVQCCGWIVGLVGFVMWIVFWVQVIGYSGKLTNNS
jgi:hypothetical protein